MSNQNLSSLEKAIVILKHLAREPYHFTALELSKALKINRSTVHRVLIALKDEMLVLQSPTTKKYKLGPMSYHIGSAYLHGSHYLDEVFHIVDETAQKIELSVGYSVLDNDRIINLYESEHYVGIRMGYKAGTLYPIHCGAYGKTIMAFYQPLEDLKKIVYSTELIKKNEKTITDPEELLREYEHIRQQGYAISDEENAKGAIGIGFPIKNSSHEVIGAIAAAAIKATVTPEKLEFYKEVLMNAAHRISKLIP